MLMKAWQCEDVASGLRDLKVNAHAFHAKLKDDERDALLHHWKAGDVECIVATIAFGMVSRRFAS